MFWSISQHLKRKWRIFKSCIKNFRWDGTSFRNHFFFAQRTTWTIELMLVFPSIFSPRSKEEMKQWFDFEPYLHIILPARSFFQPKLANFTRGARLRHMLFPPRSSLMYIINYRISVSMTNILMIQLYFWRKKQPIRALNSWKAQQTISGKIIMSFWLRKSWLQFSEQFGKAQIN